ncbi:Calreticulin-3 [Camellia lanceoleosa]|uniref:Calreticulin-3 n=1 Tax=Camellia lanceoleosa TaxID=1840588 RepID=A0ACC0H4Y7_9ERIC|nr:Calreticulin-3 [Camellia lanceoleosa]
MREAIFYHLVRRFSVCDIRRGDAMDARPPLILLSRKLPDKKIKNPNYKGKWKTPWIDNPALPGIIGALLLHCRLKKMPLRRQRKQEELRKRR